MPTNVGNIDDMVKLVSGSNPAKQQATAEERIAAALEFQNIVSMPDMV